MHAVDVRPSFLESTRFQLWKIVESAFLPAFKQSSEVAKGFRWIFCHGVLEDALTLMFGTSKETRPQIVLAGKPSGGRTDLTPTSETEPVEKASCPLALAGVRISHQ
jgi:hypothetical protein